MKFLLQFVTQFRDMFNSLSKGRKVVFVGTLSASIVGLVTLIMMSQRPTFDVLYSNLSQEDAGVILSKLKEQKTPYRLSSNGTSILVPVEDVYETRLGLASEGLPQGGSVGFEIFDKTKIGVTEFVQNVNYQRALQGELARTITQLAGVERARVHIVIPQRSLFVEDQKEATASVVVKLKPGAGLTRGQLQGVVHLVASGVEGLNPEKIIVMDNHGQILIGGRERSLSTQLTNSQTEVKRNIEKNLEQAIQTMLERAVGKDKALARVFVTLDFKQTERTEERYDPDSVVVRSEQISNEKSTGRGFSPRGVPGVVSNIPGANIPGDKGSPDTTGESSEFQRKNETINYEVSKTTSRIIESVGDIKRLSAAVIVDGTYEVVKGEDGKEGKKYVQRSDEEMERIKDIVKVAVGYDGNRGDQVEVVNMPFDTVPLMGEGEVFQNYGLKPFWSPIFKLGMIFLGLVFFFFFVVRPLVRWLTLGREEEDLRAQLPKTVGELEAGIEETKGLPSTKARVLKLAQDDTERTAQLVRQWLSEGK